MMSARLRKTSLSKVPIFQISESAGSQTQDSNSQMDKEDEDLKPFRPKVKNYQWSDWENEKYYLFLLKIKQKGLLTAQTGKIRKINVKMSRQVGSRTSIQCRSHNQKMLKRLGSIDAIIAHFSKYFANKNPTPLVVAPDIVLGQLKQQVQKQTFQQQITQRNPFLWPITQWDVKYAFNQSPRMTLTNI